jgi:hypothetical protein
MPRRLRNADRLADALALLRAGESLRAVEAQLGINRRSLADYARRAKIPLAAPGHPEEYPLDHGAFAAVASPAQAYMVGLLMADGCVHEPIDGRAPIVSLVVRAADVYLCEQFCAVVGTPPERIRYFMATARGKAYPAAGVAVSSRRLADDLAQHGVVPNKTDRTEYAHHLPLDLQRHWLRGLWDGDGATAYRTDGVARLHLGFCGSYALIADVRQVLVERCALSLTPALSPNGRSQVCWRTQWRGRDDVRRIAAYLFGAGGPSLPRKRATLLEALGLSHAELVADSPLHDSGRGEKAGVRARRAHLPRR